MIEKLFSRFERGRTLMQLQRYREAIDVFEAELTGGASDGLRLTMIGQCHYELDDLTAAEQSLNAAIVALPDYAFAHYLMGMTLMRRDKRRQAKNHFETALELEPEDKLPPLGMAKYHMVGQSYGEAERYIDAALEIAPTFIDALQLKAILLSQGGKGREAAAVAATALEQNPNNPRSLQVAGYVSNTNGNPKAAEMFYGQSLEAEPSREAAYQYLEAGARGTTHLVVTPLTSTKQLLGGLLAFFPLTALSQRITSVWFDGFLIACCLAIIVVSLVPFAHIAFASIRSFGRVMVFQDWHQMRNLFHFIAAVACYALFLYSMQDVFLSAALFLFGYGLIGLGLQVHPSSRWNTAGYAFLGVAYLLGLGNFILDFTAIGSSKLISQVLLVGALVFVFLAALLNKLPTT